MEEMEKSIADFKDKLPNDACCKAPDFKLYQQCPKECSYLDAEQDKCNLQGTEYDR